MKPHEQTSSPEAPEEHLSFDQIDERNAALDARLRALEKRWNLPSPEAHDEEQPRPDLEARGIVVPQGRTGNERHFVGSDPRFDSKKPAAPSPADILFTPTTDTVPDTKSTPGGAKSYEEVLLGGTRNTDQDMQNEPLETTETKTEVPFERFVTLSDAANEATKQGALESDGFNKLLTGQEDATSQDARTAAIEAVVATGVLYKQTRRGFMLTGPDGKKQKVASRNCSPVEIIKAAEQMLRVANPNVFTPHAVFGMAMDHVANEKGNRITSRVRNLVRRAVGRKTIETSMVTPDLMRIASIENNAEDGTAIRAAYLLVNSPNAEYYDEIESDVEYATQQSLNEEATEPFPTRVNRSDAIIYAGAASREVMKSAKVPLSIAVGAAALLGGALFMSSTSQSEAPSVSEARVVVDSPDQQSFAALPVVPEVPQVPAVPTTQPETKSFSVTFDDKSTLWSANSQLLKQAGVDASPAAVDILNRKMLDETGANQYNLHAGSKVMITVDKSGKVVSSHADLH